jgi:hypothetical protein
MKIWPYDSYPLFAWTAVIVWGVLAFWGALTPPLTGTIKTVTTHVESGHAESNTPVAMADQELYRQVIANVAAGQPYYETVAQLHRANNYPLRPAVTVRLPTLAWLSAALGPIPTFLTYLALIAACIVAWSVRLRQIIPPSQRRELAPAIVIVAFAATASPVIVYFHEAWAGILIALGLALWRPERLWPSVVALFCAALFREMAVCAMVVMLAMAGWERRWKEAAVWLALIAVFAGVMVGHFHGVAQVVRPDDMASPGWHGMGGWPLVVSATKAMSFLIVVPRVVAAIVIPAMLLGWAWWRHPLAGRVMGVVVGYGMAIALFSRPDTPYWALLFAPLLSVGLLFLPVREIAAALRKLGQGFRSRLPS